MTTKRRRKGRPADYRGATPEQVAQAVHRHRPNELENAPKPWLRIELVRGTDGGTYMGNVTEHDERPPPHESS